MLASDAAAAPTDVASEGSDMAIDAGPARITSGLVALYTFEEGAGTTVNDRSGVGAPLNLAIPQPASVTWGDGVLQVTAPTLIESGVPAMKLIEACRAANEVTLEAWITPTSIAAGYLRVVTLALNNSDLAITLMAIGDHFEFRMRGPMTDSNGLPSLNSPAGTVALAPTHVVLVSESSGARYLYVNGVVQANDARGGDLSAWGATHRFGLASEIDGTGPWLGTYDLVAVYARALTAEEVAINYAVGPQ